MFFEVSNSYRQKLYRSGRGRVDRNHREEYLSRFFESFDQQQKSSEVIREAEKNFLELLSYNKEEPFPLEVFRTITSTLRKWNAFSASFAICENALSWLIHKGKEDSSDYLFILNERGEVEFLAGNLDKAEKTFRSVLKKRIALTDCSPEDLSESFNNLAMTHKTGGKYRLAEKYYKKALSIRDKKKDDNPLLYAQSIANLALLYRILGAYEKAEPYYLSALEIRRKRLSPTHPEIAQTMNSLGVLYLYMGQYLKAEKYFKSIADQYRSQEEKDSIGFAQVQNNFAGFYYQLGKYSDAERLYASSFDKCSRLLGNKHYFTVHTAINKAKAAFRLGETERALLVLQEYLPVCEQLFPPGHVLRITAESLYGSALYQTGDYSAAETCLSSSLQNAETSLGPYHPLTCEILLQRGILDTVTGRRDQALTHLYESCRRQTGMITRIAKAFPEQYIVQYMKTLNESNAIFLSFVQRFYPTDQNALEKALEIIMRRKAVSYESSLMQQQTLYEKQGAKTKALLRKLTKARMELARRVIGEWEQKESSEMFFARVRELEKQCEELESELARNLPQAGALLTLEKASRTAIQSRLKNEETLVDFVRYPQYEFGDRGVTKGEEVYAGLMVWKGGPLCLAPLGNAREMDQEIEAFRKAIQPGDGNRGLLDDEEEEESTEITVRRALKRSYACLFEPLRKRRFGKHEPDFVPEWIFAPEGQINLVPFEALITPSGRFSVEENRIRYITTARELLWQEEVRPVQQKSAVLFANPAFLIPTASPSSVTSEKNPYLRSLRDSLSAFEPLPGTEQEAKEISELFTEKGLLTDTYTGREASKKNFVKTQQPYLLHIATHGFFMGERQTGELSNTIPSSFRSGIVLSGVNNYLQGTIPSKAMQTPILTSFDIFGMNLSGTELVTLSACETGLGLIENGEGVMGLRRSFLTAGAKTVISSLWKVPDDATKTLMALFYKNLLEGRQKSEALREAQLALIAQYKSSDGFAFPWLWAGFICLGADNPIASLA